MAHAKVQPHGAALFIAAAASVVFLVSGITSILSGQIGGTAPVPVVVDDSDKTGFATEGSFWYRSSTQTAYKKNLRVTSLMNMYFTNQKPPAASWKASLKPGTYDVQMTWQSKSFLTDSATVTVRSGDKELLPALTLNQKKAPVGEQTEKVLWQSLGSITLDEAKQVTVRLAGPVKSPAYKPQINGLQMTADAVRFVPKQQTELTVQVKSSVAQDTAVRNQKNVRLLRFEAGASKEFDRPVVTKAVFTADSGSPLNAQNYALWMDVDGDGETETLVQDGVYAENDLIVFDGLGEGGIPLTIQSRHFEVRGDISSSTVNDTLRLRFADVDDVLMAEDAATGAPLVGVDRNGSCKECAIHLSDANAVTTEYRIIAQGNLYVTKDTMPVRSHQLLGGTLGDAVLLIRLRAENEDVDVTDLQLTSHAGTATSVERLELYTMGATTPFAVATTAACGSDNVPTADFNGEPAQTFCANMESGQLVIPEGNTVSVSVRPRMKTDANGGVSGENIAFFISDAAVSDNVTGEGAVRARGAVSSADLSANNGDTVASGEVFIGKDMAGPNAEIRGNTNHVVLSKLMSITNANPDADNSSVPTGVTPFGQFKFSAAANQNTQNGLNRWSLDAVIFGVNATNVELNSQSLNLYNKADTSAKHACSVLNAAGTPIGEPGTGVSGNLYVVCDNLGESPVSADIASGDSAVFVLEGEVTRSAMMQGASVLQASIESFNDITKNDSFGWNQSHLKWFDEDTAQTVFRWAESDNTVVKSTVYKSEGSTVSSVRSSSVSSIPGSCTSTAQCQNGMRCSTEWMDCNTNCPPGAMCPAVCTGRCMYVDTFPSSSSRMSSSRNSVSSSSSNDNDIVPMPVIYDTERGSGLYDKMTYASYKSTILLKPKKEMRVSAISPDINFCNGSCTVKISVTRPNTPLADFKQERTRVQEFDRPGALADDALRRFFTMDGSFTLLANTEYTVTVEATTTKSVGIYTAGEGRTREHPNAMYRLVSAEASYGMDAASRGPVAFRIHGMVIGGSSSSQAICGNGIKEGNEQCDDGNGNNTDGCSNQCYIISYDYFCDGRPSPTPCSSSSSRTSSSRPSSSSASSIPGSCTSTAQCQNGMRCSTERGDCRPCPAGTACASVCYGICQYVDVFSSSSSSFRPSSSSVASQTGNLYITKDIAPVPSRQLLGGTLTEPVLRLSLRSDAIESIDVTSLQFTGMGQNSGSTPDILRSVDRLELYKEGATTPFAIATPSGCSSSWNGSVGSKMCVSMNDMQLVVPAGMRTGVIVRARMKTDAAGGMRNDMFALNILADVEAVKARGTQSSNALAANNGDTVATGEVFIGTDYASGQNVAIAGSKHQTVMAKIIGVTNASPDADNVRVPMGVSPIGQFKFTAAANTNTLNGLNKAELRTILFNVTAKNVVLKGQSFKAYNKADTSSKVQCSAITAVGAAGESVSGSFFVQCDLSNSAVSGAMDPGANLTLVLEADIAAAPADSLLQVSLQQFNDMNLNGTFGPAQSHIEWSDRDIDGIAYQWIEFQNTVVNSTLYRN